MHQRTKFLERDENRGEGPNMLTCKDSNICNYCQETRKHNLNTTEHRICLQKGKGVEEMTIQKKVK